MRTPAKARARRAPTAIPVSMVDGEASSVNHSPQECRAVPRQKPACGLSSFSSSMDRNRKNSLRKSDSLRQTRAHLYPLTLTPRQLWTQTSPWVPFQVKSRFTERKILLKKSVLQEEQVSFEKRLSSVRSHFLPSVNSPHVAVLEPTTAARWGGSKQVKRSQDQRGGGGGSAAFRKSTVGGEGPRPIGAALAATWRSEAERGRGRVGSGAAEGQLVAGAGSPIQGAAWASWPQRRAAWSGARTG